MATANRMPRSFFQELKRRKVMRACAYYLFACWAVLLLDDKLFPLLGLDAGSSRQVFIYLASVGLPVTLALSWYFQISGGGIVRTTSFEERRILRNMAPINDQRRDGGQVAASQPMRKEFRWSITAETGPLSGLTFGIAKAVVIGRSLECDIALVSPNVSARHTRLDLVDGQLVVEDLDSASGTVVNGRRLKARQELFNEDELRLHDVVFRVSERPATPA